MRNIFTLAFVLASAANAAIVTYTDRNAFLAAISGASYEESFAGIGLNSLGANSMNFSGNGLSYTISTTSTLFGVDISGDRSMSVSAGTAPLTISSLAGGITAVGGYFYFDNTAGEIAPSGTGTITVNNGVDSAVVVNVTAPTSLTSFYGFTSNQAFTSLEYVRTGLHYSNVDDLIVGAAANQGVPEPSSIGLALAGLAALAVRRFRK